MGGFDMNDNICQYCEVLRKGMKRWKTLFFHLFNMLFVNSYILYRKYGQLIKRRIHQTFRQELAHALIDSATTAPHPIPNKGRKSEPIDRLVGRHFPAYIPCKEGAKRLYPLRDCKACNVSQYKRDDFKRKPTSFYCPDCNVSLCVPQCFKLYHSNKHFRGEIASQSSDTSD